MVCRQPAERLVRRAADSRRQPGAGIRPAKHGCGRRKNRLRLFFSVLYSLLNTKRGQNGEMQYAAGQKEDIRP